MRYTLPLTFKLQYFHVLPLCVNLSCYMLLLRMSPIILGDVLAQDHFGNKIQYMLELWRSVLGISFTTLEVLQRSIMALLHFLRTDHRFNRETFCISNIYLTEISSEFLD